MNFMPTTNAAFTILLTFSFNTPESTQNTPPPTVPPNSCENTRDRACVFDHGPWTVLGLEDHPGAAQGCRRHLGHRPSGRFRGNSQQRSSAPAGALRSPAGACATCFGLAKGGGGRKISITKKGTHKQGEHRLRQGLHWVDLLNSIQDLTEEAGWKSKRDAFQAF